MTPLPSSPATTERPSPGLSRPARRPAPSLGATVLRELVDMVVTGEVRPGATLPPEGPLAEHFGVSRTTVRESVKRLEEKGLVRVEQGRGTTVNDQDRWYVHDPLVLAAMIAHDESSGALDELSNVRAALEAEMAAVAAQEVLRLRTEGDALDDPRVTRLVDALGRMREGVDAEHDRAFRQADLDFHFAALDLAGNRLASSIARVLVDEALMSERYHGHDEPGHLAVTLSEHEAVAEAVLAGLATQARDAMRRHILDSWDRRRLDAGTDGAQG